MSRRDEIRIGLYGTNGHQLPLHLPPQARVVAVAGDPRGRAARGSADSPWSDQELDPAIRVYDDLPTLLADPEVDLVSLCSARRIEQADQAIRCLWAGKHVLAEKPCAFSADKLDEILIAAAATGRAFREMAASELAPPLQAIRRLVDQGSLGTIIHVQAQKSYPWHDRRPQDIAVDGGLVRQVGIHAVRFIHGATGQRIRSVWGKSTGLGNPGQGEIQMAAAFSIELENGALGTINLNYLNPANFGCWGNDQLRVFGTAGMAETVDGFRRSRLYLPDRESTELPIPDDLLSPTYIEHYVRFLLEGKQMPTPLQEEIAMTRAMLTLHEASVSGERMVVPYPDREW